MIIYFNLAPMGSDNFMNQGQPQAQTGFSRRIEGIEYIVEIFRIDSLPGIFHFHLDTG
jgi:hypothetical protein